MMGDGDDCTSDPFSRGSIGEAADEDASQASPSSN